MANRTETIMHFFKPAVGRLLPALTVVAALGVTACTPETAPPFELTGEGAVEGLIYFDTQRDNRFDPSDGDFALGGIDLEIRERGTDRVFAGSRTTTAADGRFLVEGVPPGTHDLWIDEATLPEEVVVCQNPLQVSVYLNEPATVAVSARDACLITIAEARELGAGEFVNIRGIVTSHPGQVQSSYVYIQDATGGMQFFTSALNDAGLEIGDRIDVSGVLDEFNNTLQLINVQLNEVEPGVGAPAPRETATQEIAAEAWNPSSFLQGVLVVIRGAQLQSPFDSGGNRNARIDDGSGPALLRVASGVVSGSGDAILSALGLDVGACYDIVGLAGGFGSDGQLFLRSADDFEEVACE